MVVLFLGLVIGSRLIAGARSASWRDSWTTERRRIVTTVVVATVALAGWCAASFVSNQTFLFPVVGGTWNHELSLRPVGLTWVEELQFLVSCCIESIPISVLPALVIVLAVTVDRRPGAPLGRSRAAATSTWFARWRLPSAKR